MAGFIAVSLHDRLKELRWLRGKARGDEAYDVTQAGVDGFKTLGVDVEATRMLRRRFAYACLDWSERRPHLGGALAAALLNVALQRKWVVQELDSRALSLTGLGRREMRARFGVEEESLASKH